MAKKKAAKPRTKMTKAEEEYMINHRGENMQKIADDIGRSYEFVRKFMGGLPEEEVEPKSQKGTRPINDHGVITQTMKGNRGVAVMTEAASQRADEARKGRKKTLGPKNAVRKIREDN